MRTIILLVLGLACDPIGWADESPPLAVEAKIALGDIKGRIDHLAIDVTHQRLFVAQLGNNAVGVIDIAGRRVLRTMTGFDEPQGLAGFSRMDEITLRDRNSSDRMKRGEITACRERLKQ